MKVVIHFKHKRSEYNTKLWNSGIESNKDIARRQKRKLEFISNIYVIKDPANPENEGKVFLFRYGKKIYDKLDSVMNPKFEDDTPMNPFDLWTGANLKLRIRQKDGYRNYDESSFDIAGPLFKEESKMEEVWNSCYSLQEFVKPSEFKSYDQLKARLNAVLGEIAENNIGSAPKTVEKAVVKKTSVEVVSSEEPPFDPDSSSEDLDYFKQLAQG